MQIKIHRKEQYDLECTPIVCVHVRRPNVSARVFCVWRWGIQIGRWCWVPKARLTAVP